jgi:hypothetical protein
LFKVSDPPELTVSVIPLATVTCPTLTAVPLWMTGWLATLGMLAVSPVWGVVPPQVDQLPAVAQFVDEAPVHPQALARACRAGARSAKNARTGRTSLDTEDDRPVNMELLLLVRMSDETLLWCGPEILPTEPPNGFEKRNREGLYLASEG